MRRQIAMRKVRCQPPKMRESACAAASPACGTSIWWAWRPPTAWGEALGAGGSILNLTERVTEPSGVCAGGEGPGEKLTGFYLVFDVRSVRDVVSLGSSYNVEASDSVWDCRGSLRQSGGC